MSHHANQHEATAPLAHLHGQKPDAPQWFVQAMAHAPERSQVQVQGAAIEALAWGERGKPGLLLMHGNSAHADWYSFIAPQLSADFRVVALSFSGMGGSHWRERYGVAQWADEALAVAEAGGLFDAAAKPVFFGHSFGGFPMMNASGRFGDRLRLAIIADTPLRTRDQTDQRDRERHERPEIRPHRIYDSIEQAVARFRLLPPQRCEHLFILDHIARTSLKPAHQGDGRPGWTWKFDPGIFRQFQMGKPGADLRAARCPVAWLNGGRSSLIDDRVRENIQTWSPPGTLVRQLPDADHHLMIDQPLAFANALREIIAAY